jgi:chromosome segregation ATPase
LFEDYKNFLSNGQEMLEIMKDYEQQSQLIEVQKTEIKKLQDTSNSAIKQVQELESEKAGLTDKLKKFAELSSKYKKHMNDVVKAQKYLKSQANEIQKSANEAIESTKQAAETRAATEAALQKIEIVVNDAKSFRVPAESFALGEQIASWYIQLSLTEDSIQAEPRPRGRKPRASGRNPKATGWNPKASR